VPAVAMILSVSTSTMELPELRLPVDTHLLMRGKSGSSLIAICRCGRSRPVHKLVGRNKTFDRLALTFQCGSRECRWVRVRCSAHRSRRCRDSWLVPPSSSASFVDRADEVATAECGPCRLSKRARRPDFKLRRLRSLVANKIAVAWVDRASAGDRDAQERIRGTFRRSLPRRDLARLAAATRRPRPLKAIRNIIRAELSRPFELCPLCLQTLYRPRHVHRWVKRFFHPDCLKAWLEYSGQHWGTGQRLRLPEANRSSGRPIDVDTVKRGYVCLMRLKGNGIQMRTRGESIATSLEGLAGEFTTTKPNIIHSIRQFFRYAPASWKFIFPESSGSIRREQLCSLRHELRARGLLEDHERSARVERLLGFGMAIEMVAELVGWSVQRVADMGRRTGYQPARGLGKRRSRKRQYASRRRRARGGQCWDCGRRARPGRSLCAAHAAALRSRQMQKTTLICEECGLAIASEERKRGRRFHPACAQRRRAASRVARRHTISGGPTVADRSE
jgi:transcription elongation factor Elf1